MIKIDVAGQADVKALVLEIFLGNFCFTGVLVFSFNMSIERARLLAGGCEDASQLSKRLRQ